MFAAAKKPRVDANLNHAFRVVETEKDENEKDETEEDEIESQYLDPEDITLDFSPSDLKVVNKIYQHITKNHDLMDKLEEIDSKVTGYFGYFAGWLLAFLAGWLLGWLVSWLAGLKWLRECQNGFQHR